MAVNGGDHDDQIMDTRTPSPAPSPRPEAEKQETDGDQDYKPDLSAEVAMLSTKLVNAINFQTSLDDTLQHTRHELEQMRQENARLRAEKESRDQLFTTGAVVQKSDMDRAIAKVRAELILERSAKETAEKAKKQTEGELENLTTALFEEANTMVAAARKDTEAVEKRNQQLRTQLQDTELLLASQQEQLQDLKATMGRIRDASPSARGEGSIPSTPILASSGHFEAMMNSMMNSPGNHSNGEIGPEPSLHYPHLLTTILRDDIPAHNEFQELLHLARRLGAHSRQSSNSGNPSSNSLSNPITNTSSPSLPGAFTFSSTTSSPSSPALPATTLPPLKDSRFYKRALVEDLDPTLRLDLAPGLSFLSRRAAFSALLTGSLSIEPFPTTSANKHYHACALCGESRRSEQHVRRWKFRNSEEDGVVKPLCAYCVGRVRASCDFVAFLRAVREGLWREKEGAWEESVRLREAMWWSRIGGGVVPTVDLVRGGEEKAEEEKPLPRTPTRVSMVVPRVEDEEGGGKAQKRLTIVPLPPPRTVEVERNASGADEAKVESQVQDFAGSRPVSQVRASPQIVESTASNAGTEEETFITPTATPDEQDAVLEPHAELEMTESAHAVPAEASDPPKTAVPVNPPRTPSPQQAEPEPVSEVPAARASLPPPASDRPSVERSRGSGVLARVRAMEARASQ